MDSQHTAASVTRECAEALQSMRRKLVSVFEDPEFLLRRMKADEGHDDLIVAVGRKLEAAMHSSFGRTIMIEQGMVGSGPEEMSLERVQPVSPPAFVPLTEAHSIGRV